MVVLVVDDAAAAHLVVALRNHERRLRVDGRRLPKSVGALVAALSADGDGQVRPVLAADDPAVDDLPMLFDSAELGAVLHVSERTARRLMASGEVPAVEVAGRRLTRSEDLRRYIERLPTSETKSMEEN